MKITIEANGYKVEVTEDMFEDFLFSMHRDVIQVGATEGGVALRELGHAHLTVGGRLKDDVKPEWVKS